MFESKKFKIKATTIAEEFLHQLNQSSKEGHWDGYKTDYIVIDIRDFYYDLYLDCMCLEMNKPNKKLMNYVIKLIKKNKDIQNCFCTFSHGLFIQKKPRI